MLDSITEGELFLPVLQVLARSPGGFCTTSELIVELDDMLKPQGKDATIIENRSDTYFSQKVRNIIAHRKTGASPIKQGYLEYVPEREGLKITEKGRVFLKSQPE